MTEWRRVRAPATTERCTQQGDTGVTSGASVPEVLVRGVVDRLAELGFTDVAPVTTANETLVFALPHGVRQPKSSVR